MLGETLIPETVMDDNGLFFQNRPNHRRRTLTAGEDLPAGNPQASTGDVDQHFLAAAVDHGGNVCPIDGSRAHGTRLGAGVQGWSEPAHPEIAAGLPG